MRQPPPFPSRLRSHLALAAVALFVAMALVPAAVADEGMWTFNDFPFERFEAEYGFRPSQEWLDHVRLASVRFNNGGSGSFVSPDGLVITNHHVGSECIQALSSAEHDYLEDGFVAATRERELPCPDLELNVLTGIERVTARIREAERPGMGAAAAADARRAAMAAVEEECVAATGLRCDVVTLYAGGEYDLYRYHRYTDVRLAFAPELQLAFFGGDPDNFEYPRYCLDVALFRVYEEGRPAEIEHFLAWGTEGPEEGEVTFVSGNPGSTGRLATVAQLAWLRDVQYPMTLDRGGWALDRLASWSSRGEEEARIAQDDVLSIENAVKATSGYEAGLLDAELMERKAAAEEELRRAFARRADDRGDGEAGGKAAPAERAEDPWARIESAVATHRTFYPRFQILESGIPGAGHLPAIARSIVRLAEEKTKPSGERLREYRETALPSLLQGLYAEVPLYPDYEAFRLAAALERFRSQLGPIHPLVITVLGDSAPAEVAAEAIAGTRLGEVAFRRRLVEGGKQAVAASEDPLIRLLAAIEPEARRLRGRFEQEVDSVEEAAGAEIAETYFAMHGKDTYPDATFTLRLSYGRAVAYEEGGRAIPWHTTFAGLFERAEAKGHRPPYELTPALEAAAEELDRELPLDFLTTNDIIGGNSGSPILDRDGRFVGIAFDGNLHILPNRFIYSMEKARTIAVDSRAILEALTVIYPADHLAHELLGRPAATESTDSAGSESQPQKLRGRPRATSHEIAMVAGAGFEPATFGL